MPTPQKSFETFAGVMAVLTGISGLLYAISFVIISQKNPELGACLSAIFLMLGGLLAVPFLVALYHRVREANPGFASLAFITAMIGAFGSMIHGAYDLANVINPPLTVTDLPSAIDPRGILTFGMVGLGLFVNAWLIQKGKKFAPAIAIIGYILAILLIFIYIARLTVLSPANPILLIPVLMSGFVFNPLWYLVAGISLLRKTRK